MDRESNEHQLQKISGKLTSILIDLKYYKIDGQHELHVCLANL